MSSQQQPPTEDDPTLSFFLSVDLDGVSIPSIHELTPLARKHYREERYEFAINRFSELIRILEWTRASASTPMTPVPPYSSPAPVEEEEEEGEQKRDANIVDGSFLLSPLSPSPRPVRASAEDVKKFLDVFYHYRGLCLHNLGYYRASLPDFDASIELAPPNAVYYCNRARTYIRLKEFECALRDVAKAIREMELQCLDRAYYLQALCYRGMKKLDLAICSHTQSLLRDNTCSKYYAARGITYRKMKQFDHAIRDFDEAIRLDGSNAKAFYDRGRCYRRKKELENSLRDLTKAIELNPGQVVYVKERAITFFRLRRYDEAFADISEVIHRGDYEGKTIYLHRGFIFYCRREFQKAVEDFLKCKSDAQLLWCRGICRGFLEETDAASRDFIRARGLDSELSVLSLLSKRFDHLVPDLEMVLQKLPEEEPHVSRLCQFVSEFRERQRLQIPEREDNRIQFRLRQTSRMESDSWSEEIEGRVDLNGIRLRQVSADPEGEHSDFPHFQIRQFPSRARRRNSRVGQPLPDVPNGSPFSGPIADEDALRREATRHFEEGRFWEASCCYSRLCLRGENTTSSDHNMRGLCVLRLGETRASLLHFGTAIRMDPCPSYYCNRAGAFFLMEEFDQCIEDVNNAIKLDPEYARAFRYRAFCFVEKGLSGEAIRDHDSSIRLLPNASNICARAVTLFRMRRFDLAELDFDQAFRQDPKDEHSLSKRAMFYRSQKKFERAVCDFDELIRLNRDNSVYFRERGRTYLGMDLYKNALADLDHAVALDFEDKKAQRFRGYALYCLRLFERAREDFNSDSRGVFWFRALCSCHELELASASEEFLHAYRNDSDFRVLGYLAQMMSCVAADLLHFLPRLQDTTEEIRKIRDFVMSLSKAKRGVSLLRQRNHSAPGVLHVSTLRSKPRLRRQKSYQGRIFLLQGRYQEAIDDLTERIGANSPICDELFWVRGLCRCAMGKHEMAFADIVRSFALNPKFPGLETCLSEVNHLLVLLKAFPFFRPGSTAIRALWRFVQKLRFPKHESPEYFLLRGTCYCHFGNFRLAGDEFARAFELDPSMAGFSKYLQECGEFLGLKFVRWISILEDSDAVAQLRRVLDKFLDFDHSELVSRRAKGVFDLTSKTMFDLNDDIDRLLLFLEFQILEDKATSEDCEKETEEEGQETRNCDLSQIEPEKLCLYGFRFFEAKEFDKALPYFTELSGREGALGLDWALTGRCLQKLGNFEQSARAFSFAIEKERSEKRAVLFVCRSLSHCFLRQFRNALSDARTAAQLDSSNPEAHFLKGVCYFETDCFGFASTSLCRALGLYPSNSTFLTERAKTRFFLRSFEDALTDIENVLKKSDSSSSQSLVALLYHCQILMARNSFGDAIAPLSDLLDVSDIPPKVSLILLALRGLCYCFLREFDGAESDFRQCSSMGPDVFVKLRKVVILLESDLLPKYLSIVEGGDFVHSLRQIAESSAKSARSGQTLSESGVQVNAEEFMAEVSGEALPSSMDLRMAIERLSRRVSDQEQRHGAEIEELRLENDRQVAQIRIDCEKQIQEIWNELSGLKTERMQY